MLYLLFLAALLQSTNSQQYQKTAPGVPPQNYQNYQQPPPPPPPQQQQYQQQQQQFQQPPPQQQQFQQPPQQQFQQPQQVPVQQQVPMQQQQVPIQQQQVPIQQQQQVPQQQGGHAPHGHGNPADMLNPANIEHEREHIKEHMDVPIDMSNMSDQEMQFHYFKMHDSDNNNKLDGCELIKSLIHWHEQGNKNQQEQGNAPTGEKVFGDEELVNLIDPILKMDDHNKDGYIDYPEFVRAQQKSQAQAQNNQQ